MGMHHWGGWRGFYRPAPFFFLPMLIIGFFLFFGLLKFLWPLLLIGLGIALFRMAFKGDPRRWKSGQWGDNKPKRGWEEKPKRDVDERRFIRTADGEDVEII
jgi:hypothetical protein